MMRDSTSSSSRRTTSVTRLSAPFGTVGANVEGTGGFHRRRIEGGASDCQSNTFGKLGFG